MNKPRTHKTRSRQLSRKEISSIIVRALLATAAEGEIEFGTVGRIVARIIKFWPQYSLRQADEVERDWMRALRAEVAARNLPHEREARVSVRAAEGRSAR